MQQGSEKFLSFEEEQIDLKNIFLNVLSKWYYFAISVPLFLVGAYFYLKYTTPIYSVSATVIIDDGSTATMSAADVFAEMNMFSGKNNINNEIEILKSYNMVNRTLQQLDFDVSYFKKGTFREEELYKKAPFVVKYDSMHQQVFGFPFDITFISDNIYILEFEAEEFWSIAPANRNDYSQNSYFTYKDTLHLGQTCTTKYFSFSLQKGGNYTFNPDGENEFSFTLNNLHGLTNQYRAKVEITPADLASVLVIKVSGPIPQKEIDFLNTYCQTYIQWQLDKKTHIATNTIDFIDSQILQITDSLQGAEAQLESFRRRESVMDIGSAAANATGRLQALETEQAQLQVKDQYYRSLLSYLRNSDFNTIVAPSSININDPILNASILELKQLNQQKVKLSFSANEKNKELQILNDQIEYAKNSLIEQVRNMIEGSSISLNDVNRRIAEVKGIIYELPSNERNLVKIQRKFNFSDNLYNYLLQKRAEAGISKASSMPDNYVLDYAQQIGSGPISPNTPFIYAVALILSLIFPASVIAIQTLTDTKVADKNQLERLTTVPLLGSVARKKDEKMTILNAPQSGLAESFRALRVNLQFLTGGQEFKKVIGITSTISGEGKTFCAFNLAVILAISGKKTIVIGADLRKPRLASQLEVSGNGKGDGVGLSNYLIHKTSIEEIIQSTHIENLDMIGSGAIPPNPAELLESSKLDDLFAELRTQYDYIIVDAPPVGLVTDYYILSNHVDVTIYVVRQGYSEVQFVKDLEKAYQEKRLKNVSVILNDVSRTGEYGYGGGYGYGYYSEDKKRKKGILQHINIF